jgi:YD repeat-containing protein
MATSRIEQLEDGGRTEFLFRDEVGEPADEDEATHVEVIEYDAEGRFISSTIAKRNRPAP